MVHEQTALNQLIGIPLKIMSVVADWKAELIDLIFLGHGSNMLRKSLRSSLVVCCGGMSVSQVYYKTYWRTCHDIGLV